MKAALEAEVTCIPLWKNRPENIVGILHAKDPCARSRHPTAIAKIDLTAIARPPWFARHPAAVRRLRLSPQDAVRAGGRRIRRGHGPGRSRTSWRRSSATSPTSTTLPCPACGRPTVPSMSTRRTDPRSQPRDGWSLPDAEATTVAGLVIRRARSRARPDLHLPRLPLPGLRRDRNRITALRIRRCASRRRWMMRLRRPERGGVRHIWRHRW